LANFWENDPVVEAPATGGNFWDSDAVEEPPVPSKEVWTPKPSAPQPEFMGAPAWLTKMLPQRDVPAPVPEAMGAGAPAMWATENLVGPVVNAVVNTPRNLAETAEILSTPGGMVNRAARSVIDTIPQVDVAPNKGIVGEGVEAIAPIFMGGSGGLKLAAAATKKVKSILPNLIKHKGIAKATERLAKGFGFEAGGVAASDIDLGTGFVGEKSAFGDSELNFLADWGFDEEGNVEEVRFEKKANQMIEGLTLAGFGDIAGKVVSKMWSGTVGPSVTAIKRGVTNLFSPDAAQNATMTDLVATLKNVDPDDPAAFDAALDKLQDVTSDPATQKNLYEFAASNPKVENVEVKKGTLDLIEDDVADEGFRGTGKENANVDEIIRLRQFENAVKGNKLAAEELAPNRALQNTLDQTREAFGGQSTVKPAAEGITKGLEEKFIRPAQEEVGGLMATGMDAQQALVNSLKTDPFFVGVAKDLTKFNPSVGKMSDDVGTDLVERVFKNYDDMRKAKNDLFKDPALSTVRGSPTIINTVVAEIDRINPKLIPTDLRNKLGTPMSLRDLEELANFNVSDLIGKARNKEAYKAAELLGKLKKSMTADQIPYMRKRHGKGDAAALRAIDKAEAYYKQYLPWRTNPILSDVADARFLSEGMQRPVEGMRAMEEGILESGTKTGGSVYTDNLVDFMETQFKNGSQDVEVLVDFALTNIAKDAQKILNAGGTLGAEHTGPILTALQKIGPLVQKADPIRYEQMIKFGEGLQKNAIDMDNFDSLINDATKRLEGQEGKVYDNIAKEFYSRDVANQTRAVLPENYESFKQVFASGDNARISEMLKVIEGNTVAMDGVKSAYTKYLRDDFLSRPGQALDKSNMLNLANMRQLADPESATYAQAKLIYGDEFAENLGALSDYVYKVNARTKAGKELGDVDAKSGDVAARKGLDKIITLIFGPLDRTGARLRTLTGQYVDSANMGQYAKAFIDEVLANPQAFNTAIKQLKASRSTMMSAQTKELLKKSIYRGIMRKMGESDAPAPSPLEDQTNELFGTGEGGQSNPPLPRRGNLN
jgi:hypothetical protein